ncbi:TldD/PmbA family protein [Paenirhodobacter sp.]|uniref:TldD/PmbA family protein n=1 Tax=Paenirhodobacter sp. TaxID=1965326 RepID=UPI003B3EBCB8
MSYSFNRRDVLRTAALGVWAMAPVLRSPAAWAQTPQGLLRGPEPDADALVVVAQKAVAAARAAGAAQADVRVLHGSRLSWAPPPNVTVSSAAHRPGGADIGQPMIGTFMRMGIRAWVGGRMGFAGNLLPVSDAETVALARMAVERARAWPGAAAEIAPAPVVTNGRWESPVRVDPFTVPIREQEQLLLDVVQDVLKTPVERGQVIALINVAFTRTLEIFVSSEGAEIRQRFHTAEDQSAAVSVPGNDRSDMFVLRTPGFAGAYGYEVFDDLRSRMARKIETLHEMRKTPGRPVDIGRHEIVLSANAAAQLLGPTIADPLQLDRALGRSSVKKGHYGSYAVPPEEALGTFRLGSELLNVRADRTRAGLTGTCGWDSEGVAAREFDLVRGGVVADYLTDRATAPALRTAYERMGREVRSNACSADTGGRVPVIKSPNLALLPEAEERSEDDLIGDVKRGYYIDFLVPGPDHAGLNVQADAAHIRQIVDGRKGDFVYGAALQFNTPQFWRELDAVGGPGSVETFGRVIDDPGIEMLSQTGVSAPPVHLRRVNVVNTKKRG